MAKSVKVNALAKTLLNILNVILPLITGPYLAKVLDRDLYGQFNNANSVLLWFLPFATFGIYNYGIRIISQNKNDKEKISKIFTSLFIMGCISSIVVTAIYFIFMIIKPSDANNSIYLVLSIQILANIFMVEWMNEAFESYGFILFKTMFVRISNVLGIFIFVRKSDDIVAYALVSSLIVLVNNLLSYIYIKRNISFSKIKLDDLKGLFKPLCVMLLLTNANMFYTYLDRLFLTIFAQPVYTTYYALSQAITSVVLNVISAIVIVTIPRLSKYLGDNKKNEYNNLLSLSSRIFFMIGIPMCIGISVLGNPIMFVYGSGKYNEAGITLSLFAIRYILAMFDMSLANQVIFIHGKEKLLTKLYFICGGINLALNSLMAIIGMVTPETLIITTFISEVILIYLMTRCIKKEIGKDISVINKYTFKYLFVSLAFYPIAIAINRYIPMNYIFDIKFVMNVLITIISCSLLYVIVLLTSKDKALIHILNIILLKFKNKAK